MTASDGRISEGAARQSAHFEAVHDLYEQHYYDPESMAYRHEFILGPLLDGLDLNHKSVADIACGSGHNSLYLKERYPDIAVRGFDISPKACADYEKRIGAPCNQTDLTTRIDVPAGSFDAALVVGGLHHCVCDLPTTLANLAEMIRPGGFLLMMEPNADYFLQPAREFWYRHDPSFDAATERALSHPEIAQIASKQFRPEFLRYSGGPAFFLTFNSMIFRLPHSLKRNSASVLTRAERMWQRLPQYVQGFFLARWRRL